MTCSNDACSGRMAPSPACRPALPGRRASHQQASLSALGRERLPPTQNISPCRCQVPPQCISSHTPSKRAEPASFHQSFVPDKTEWAEKHPEVGSGQKRAGRFLEQGHLTLREPDRDLVPGSLHNVLVFDPAASPLRIQSRKPSDEQKDVTPSSACL